MIIYMNKKNLKPTEAQIVQKLKNYEPRPKFTRSYIKKREPQGTVLAPLLFLLFIDDIQTSILECAFLLTIVSYTEL